MRGYTLANQVAASDSPLGVCRAALGVLGGKSTHLQRPAQTTVHGAVSPLVVDHGSSLHGTDRLCPWRSVFHADVPSGSM